MIFILLQARQGVRTRFIRKSETRQDPHCNALDLPFSMHQIGNRCIEDFLRERWVVDGRRA
jgi:hypothetical protein